MPGAGKPVTDRSATGWLHWTLAALLAAGAIHIGLTWGYQSLFWGDAGRWLHEVDRFASGQVLYRDFVWPFPPLALWVIGAVAWVLGSTVEVIWSTTSVIFLVLLVLFHRYAARLVDRPLLPWLLFAAFLLAVSLAQYRSAPLPLGMYSPAAPIGFALLLGALLLALDLVSGSASTSAGARPLALGVLAGAAVATKQDFWLPAAFIVGAVVVTALRGRRPIAATLACSGFLLVVAAVLAVIGATAGLAAIPGVIGGFGHVSQFGWNALPTVERLLAHTVSAGAAVGMLLAAFWVVDTQHRRRPLGRWILAVGGLVIVAATVYVGVTSSIVERAREAASPIATATEELALLNQHVAAPRVAVERFNQSLRVLPLSILIPSAALVGLLVTRRRFIRSGASAQRNVLLFLLAVAVLARARRGFLHTEWFHVLLELPVYVSLIGSVVHDRWPSWRKAVVVWLVLLASLGIYLHWSLGRGALTKSGTHEAFDTSRGVVRWPRAHVGDYQWLEGLLHAHDPTGSRPLVAFGYNGGYQYFLLRPSPLVSAHGFHLSLEPVDAALKRLLRSQHRLFLLDVRGVWGSVPEPGFHLFRWEKPWVPSHYERVDRLAFDQLRQGCTVVGTRGRRSPPPPLFTLLDCAQRESAP